MLTEEKLTEIKRLSSQVFATYQARFGEASEVKTFAGLCNEWLEQEKVPSLPDEKLIRVLNSFSKEELCELQAIIWLGRDTVASDEITGESTYQEYYEYALKNHTEHDVEYILGKSMVLPKYLARGMLAVGAI